MKCDFDYCVNNKEFHCIHGEIQINALGMCEDCEVVSIPEEHLEKYKKRRLEEITLDAAASHILSKHIKAFEELAK